MHRECSSADGLLTVAKAARAAGLPPSTVRFYEREGLITPCARSRSGYRLYGAAGVARLRFVRAAQEIGLSLKDIRAITELDTRTGRDHMQGLLESRLDAIDQRLARVSAVRDALAAALARCRSSGECCSVLRALSVGTSTLTGEHDDEEVQVQGGRGNSVLGRGDAGRVSERGTARRVDRRSGR